MRTTVKLVCLSFFPGSVVKDPVIRNLGEKGFVWLTTSILAGKAWGQEQETAGHIAHSGSRKQTASGTRLLKKKKKKKKEKKIGSTAPQYPRQPTSSMKLHLLKMLAF